MILYRLKRVEAGWGGDNKRMRLLDGITDSMDMFEQAPGVGDSEGQGSLTWCIHGVAELNMTDRLNNNKREWKESLPLKNFKYGVMSPIWQSSNRVMLKYEEMSWRVNLKKESYAKCGFNIIYQEFFFSQSLYMHQTTSTFSSHNFQLCLLSSKYKSVKWNHKWTGTINNLYHNPIFPVDCYFPFLFYNFTNNLPYYFILLVANNFLCVLFSR